MLVAFLVILVIAVVAWVVRQQSSGVQVAKAYKLAGEKRWPEAIAIFQKHYAAIPTAPAGLAEAMLDQAGAVPYNESAYQQILGLKSTLPQDADVAAFNKIAARAGLVIARERRRKLPAGDGRLDALKEGLAFVKSVPQTGIEAEYKAIVLAYNEDISTVYLELGKSQERAHKYKAAIVQYNHALSYTDGEAIKIVLSLRREICRGKASEPMVAFTNKQLLEADPSVMNDYYHRLALQHILASNLDGAFFYAAAITDKDAAEHFLNYVRNERKKSVVAQINSLNSAIPKLHEQQLNLSDIEVLYKKVQELQNSIRNTYPMVSMQLSELRPAIFNRLLAGYNRSGQYSDASKLITSYPQFWDSPELLKSLAQCAIGLVISAQLDKTNYKDALSAWLSAACSDKVILSSLEATTWDDEYTFTLADSMGAAFQQHSSLPDNVNYEEPDETNISIGETQRELITQFELLLHAHVADKTLLDEAVTFYHQQSEAIRKVVAEVSEEMLFAAPHFAEKYSLKAAIINALEADYKQYKNEQALEAALLYGAASIAGTASTYAKAKEQAITFSKAIGTGDYASLRIIAAADAMKGLQSFAELSKRYETEWAAALKAAAREDDESKELAEGMEAALKIFPQSEQLKHLFALQIADVVIGAVNKDKMSNHAAFLLMLRGYKVQPENTRVAGNLVKLVDRNLMDIINDRTTKEMEIFTELDKLQSMRSNAFKVAAHELAKTRDGILNELQRAGQDVSWLNTILTPPTVTAAGHKLKKALTKMLELSGGSLRNASVDELLRGLRLH